MGWLLLWYYHSNFLFLFPASPGAAVIQDLINFIALGKNYPEELTEIDFDMSLLAQASQLAEEASKLLARATIESDTSTVKKIRDQAFTFLKMAVDEVCDFGQFVFWDNEIRRKGYTFLVRNIWQYLTPVF
jgi:hypothetical protein